VAVVLLACLGQPDIENHSEDSVHRALALRGQDRLASAAMRDFSVTNCNMNQKGRA